MESAASGSSDQAFRAADAPDVADVRTAGFGATAPGGHPSQMGGGPFPTICDSADAQAFVDARIAEGPTTSRSFTTTSRRSAEAADARRRMLKGS